MTSHQYQQAINQVTPLLGQRATVKDVAWELCKERYGFTGELTGVVVGFFCERDGDITLMLQYDSHLHKTWSDQIDMHFIDDVEVLTPPRERELVTA